MLGINSNNKRAFNNKNKNNQEKINLRRKYIQENQLYKIVSHIEKIIELKNYEESETRNNSIAYLELAIEEALKKIDKELLINTFGGDNIGFIRNIINEEPVHRENKLNYIQNTLIKFQNEISNQRNKKYTNLIQNMYKEDPKRTMRWFITNKPTPECNIDINKLEKYFKNQYEETPNFQEPDENDIIFNLDKILDSTDNELLKDLLLDKDRINKAIITRSNLSATGPDAISNSIWKIKIKYTIKIVKNIIKQIIKFNKIPELWKNSRTVLLFKKDDPNIITNWRPISISSTLYRIIMCHINRSIQDLNTQTQFINSVQKGFKININGITEHIANLNELISQAVRSKESIYITTLDFAKAFDSVPHKLIT